MKSINVKLTNEAFEDYVFTLFINPLNTISNFSAFKYITELERFERVPLGSFTPLEYRTINMSFYKKDGFKILQDTNPLSILLEKEKNREIKRKLDIFQKSNFLNSPKYNLLAGYEVCNDLYFLLNDRVNETKLLLQVNPYSRDLLFLDNKEAKTIVDSYIEKLAVLLGEIMKEINVGKKDYILHLSERIEILLYKEELYGYAFIIDKGDTDLNEDFEVRYLFYDLSNEDNVEIIYQNELNYVVLEKLRVQAKNIFMNSSYNGFLEDKELNNINK